MEYPKVSQTSNKQPLNGFLKDIYTVPKKIGAILSYFSANQSKLFTHFSYFIFIS